MINNSIFKAYDVRGIYPEEINEGLAFRVGQAVVKHLNAKRLIVGRDGRVSSESLADEVIKGIVSAGCDVVSIGQCTTPLFYFSVNSTGAEGGIMITASHNPKEFNGFKIVSSGAEPVLVKDIEKYINEPERIESDSPGNIDEHQFVDDYVNFVLEESRAASEDLGKLKVVIDASNGMAGPVLDNLLKKINVSVIPMNFEIDGTFPSHSPDSSQVENLRLLRSKVIELGADLGVAFDGDGDRLALMDNRGEVIPADQILGLLFQAMGEPTTVYDLRISRAIKALIGEKGISSRVGYVYIKKIMRENNAELGGELSGHFFFKEMHYAESAILAMLKIITSLNRTLAPISEIVKPFRQYAHSGEIRVEARVGILKKLKETYGAGKIDETDGLMVEFPDWWFSIRPSNTESIFKLVIEAENSEKLQEKRDAILYIIESAAA